MKKTCLCAALAASTLIHAPITHAAWSGNRIDLPALQSTMPHFGATAGDQLADGRLVYGNNARLFIQQAFGSSVFTRITNAPDADPSLVLTINQNGERTLLGCGGYGNTSLYLSDPNYSSGAYLPFTAGSYQLQNYAAAFQNGRLYIAGCNDGGAHSVSAAEGTNAPVLLISGISTYSAGIALDRHGTLFVASADDNKVYAFSKSQLDAALNSHTSLTLDDGAFVVQLNVSTTLAVDEYGCLWASGWQAAGIEVYNPRLDHTFTLIPSRTNTNYKVDVFTRNGMPYVAYINQAGWTTGSAVEYGYDYAAKFARDFNRNFHRGLTSACDTVVYEFETGGWSILHPDQTGETKHWGWSEASPVPADYDGDGITDAAVFAPENGEWIISRSSDGAHSSRNWGWNAVRPVPADYDGDGLADTAVYHPDSGEWLVYSSLNGNGISCRWGWSAARAVPGDYDGDGITDFAVYYAPSGSWIVRSSASGESMNWSWGWSQTFPVPADYDGDGITDIAVYNPASGAWCIRNSSAPASPTILNWGWSRAFPVPADYDGDGKTDIAVYYPPSGSWIIRESGNPSVPRTVSWGWSAGCPVTSSAFLNLLF